jgi:GTP-binding protein Era
VLNKIDQVSHEHLADHQLAYLDLLPQAHPMTISATRGDGLSALLQGIIARLPVNPPYFPEDQLTDLYERDLAADLIREASLYLLRDEVPHGIAVRIDQYIERGEHGAYIEGTLLVEKETHKGIIIGQGGSMLKQIGSRARSEIESVTGRKIYLSLRVKVRKNWRNDEQVLKGFGYQKNQG